MRSLERTVRAATRLLPGWKPRALLVLGSGLDGVAEDMDDRQVVPYTHLPGLPQTGVAGHRGALIAGLLAGVPVLVQAGRFHCYEGHPLPLVALPARLAEAFGVEALIITNAAGGIRETFGPGTLMLIEDHINLQWRNPLVGPRYGDDLRFPDMSEPYDPILRAAARKAASEAGVTLEEGVYAAVLGPSYETAAEIRALRTLGADAVGMSTVPEVTTARAAGIRCMGLSMITNLATGVGHDALSHDEVLEVGRESAARVGAVLRGVVRGVGSEQ